MSEASSGYTGRRRERTTRRSVRVADRVARALITLGGFGTILAVGTVCVFLISVVIPLFRSSEMQADPSQAAPWTADPIHVSVDEYGMLGWAQFEDGRVRVFRADTGEALGDMLQPLDDRRMTAWSFNTDADDVCFGFEDGTVQLGEFRIAIEFLGAHQAPPEVRDTPIGEVRIHGDRLYAHPREGQFRAHAFEVRLNPPVPLADQPIERVSHTHRGTGPVIVALYGDTLAVNAVSEIRNFLTGAVTPSVRRASLPYTPSTTRGAPTHLLVSKLGDIVYVAWDDGHLRRYDARMLDAARLAESVRLIPEDGATLTSLRFLIGRTTLVAGDSRGRVTAWFNVPDEGATDGSRLTAAHALPAGPAAVSALSGSARSRMLAAGYADGSVRLFHVTSAAMLAEARELADGQGPVRAVALGAREDRMLALAGGRLQAWSVNRRHPAVNVRALFQPVWYEGYSEPRHMWQSSAAVDDFEPKYGLMPLIFGTLKATIYSMFFGLPIALLAAIYTSEFLHPRHKARVKPMIEMMASLPSVVLGFLAALVIAPVVELRVPHVLAGMFTVPVALLAGAHLWQGLPRAWTLRVRGSKLIVIGLAVLAGLAVAAVAGRSVERVLFAGDIKRWLDGQIGSGWGGWVFLLLPLAALAAAWISHRWIDPWLRHRLSDAGRSRAAGAEALKFALGLVLALALAAGLAAALTAAGFDPRGDRIHHFMGTYVQRNALIVGFIMGFAVIPIIYTIAEDALSAVPEHLRAASLGAGATPWQTAVRVIIPTAMSGLFSAAMIGLGRAVGETMIVLMAAGNTPVMQMNLFNGFRTLSANIAVELPEAPVHGTHYRVLFLAALSLFAMTFVVNTVAETVRQRFRKRAFKL
jgi:phosphate transport system permease protein